MHRRRRRALPPVISPALDPRVFGAPVPEAVVTVPEAERRCAAGHEAVRWRGAVPCWMCGGPGSQALQPWYAEL